jgi:hypothetical protein
MGGTRQSKEAELWRWRSILTVVALVRIAEFVTIGPKRAQGRARERYTPVRGGYCLVKSA